MTENKPNIVEFLDPVEIQVGDFGTFISDLKRVMLSEEPEDRHVVADLTEFSAIPNSYVRVLVKVHLKFKDKGRSLVVRARRDLRCAMRNTTYGRMLEYEVGSIDSKTMLEPISETSPPAEPAIKTRPEPSAEDDSPGYAVICGNRLVFLSTSKPWFKEQIFEVVMGLESTVADPAILDISELLSVTESELRRIVMVVMHAQLEGRAVRVHASEAHSGIVEELGLDRLMIVKYQPVKPSSGAHERLITHKQQTVSSDRLNQLLAESSAMTGKARYQEQEAAGGSKHAKKSAEQSQARRREEREQHLTDSGAVYAGPNRRKPNRFEVADALVEVNKKAGGMEESNESSALIDLSQSGSQIFSEERMHLDDRVTLRLHAPDFVGELKVEGRVVWVEAVGALGEGYHVGIRFERIPGGSMIKLRRLERKLGE